MIDAQKYKGRLEEELSKLEEELKSVGHINPKNPADWEASAPNMNVDKADKNEMADAIEEYETNTAVLKELEIRYNNVKKALKKIEDGTYGVCEISGEEIEEDRLNANPAARTCKNHIEEEVSLSS
ncbi:MAG: TraR/DksA C4-type zinc finger protein [Candidatus Pacebacteria bacterium]|jgi:RNA polymerase-binding transcription factor DksA|nr:hypothetical protein [bacterium]MDP6527495.1 TraR/DksA C4-type zinc finger protein [Candidatus Paceibacterota bacterium]MDP6659857.1 TraR/DksA C4-type zinc finger protein [Candidatus Paceibacterota bacterium]|tara:strand:- start:10953 stop:11330 length:378 start_codon:yes stop_codon:yes gene_type:complete